MRSSTTKRIFNLDGLQNRLHAAATVFLFADSLALTIAPAARQHSGSVAFSWVHWIGFIVWLVGFSLLGSYYHNKIPDGDSILLPAVSLITGWGLLTIYRINSTYGLRQTAWLVICLVVLGFVLRSPRILDFLRRYKYLWLTVGILLAALTILVGVYPGGFGPKLWLSISGLFFQPSELLKLLLIIFLAAYLADRLTITFSFGQLIAPALLLFSIAVSILLVQKDLGTSALFIILFSITVFLATGKSWQLLVSFLLILLAGIAGYFLFDLIRLRVDAWVNPWLDPSGRSYQIVQSIMAVAAGGIFGRGPGLGSPRLVPVAQSDFIFSAISEETGLVGTIALVCILILIVYRGFRVAFRARSKYHRILAGGITSFLAFQSILIIGGNVRLLPLTGVTLPFISYGGSSLLVSMLCLGILLLISDSGGEDPAQLEKPAPLFIIFGILLAGMIGIAITNSWWSVIRSTDLLSRTDNPRLAINERYSPRGDILDNSGQPINETQGEAGSYTRIYRYPPLSPVFGFDSSTYGQSGLEASLDGYLRGEKGLPATTVWWNHLIYGQPPAGQNIRTSIDMQLQQKADQLMNGRKGALVLVNSANGEILAMSSQPNVDPNQVDTMWTGWMQDPQSPLLNRATQARYPLGTLLSPFFLSLHTGSIGSRVAPGSMDLRLSGIDYSCGFTPDKELSWSAEIIAGCPEAFLSLVRFSSPTQVKSTLETFSFTRIPDFILPQAEMGASSSSAESEMLGFGENQLKATPLQVALAGAAFSNGGTIPSPALAVGYQTHNGWVYFPQGGKSPVNIPGVNQVATMLKSDFYPGWESIGKSKSSQGNFSWFLGGTSPNWNGTPLSLVVLLEDDDSLDARMIGEQLLQSSINP